MRGDTSGKEMPHSAHASFSENVMAAPGVVVAGLFVAGLVVAGFLRPALNEGGLLWVRAGSAPAVFPSAPSMVSTVTMPSASRRAGWSESARREPRLSSEEHT